MNHEQLMEITAAMPMKTIQINGQDYLQRYFAGYTADGGQHWFHRFLRSDSERHLHSHPWNGNSFVLCGVYKEQSRGIACTHSGNDHFRTYRVGSCNKIYEQTLHRIIEVEPDTWTLMYVEAGRQPQWFFIDDEGNKKFMDSSPEDWNKNYAPRQDVHS